MSDERVIAVDLASVYETAEKDGLIRILAWGDRVEVEDVTDEHVRIKTTRFQTKPDGSIEPVPASGFIVPSAASGIEPQEVVATREEAGVLKVDFVDVQQGDASAIETPAGRIILVDGGDNQLFARYLASRYRNTSEDEPRDVECIVVTHGDADHFSGLVEIQESETHPLGYKRFFMRPSSFWPAVAPDAGRSFSRVFRTATPLTDREIGSVGDLPWDGVPGPTPVPGGRRVQYASFDHVDYVNSALDAGFSLSLTGRVDTREYTARVLAIARANAALDRVAPEMRRWRMTSFQPVPAGDQDLARAEEETGVPLLGETRYRITLGRPDAERRRPDDHRVVEVEIGEVATLFVGALPRVLIKRADTAWRAVETP